MLTKDNVQDIYPLTPMQEGMLVEHARDPESAAYIEQFDFVMEGPLDIDAVGKSFSALIAKYDVLRTIFSFRKTDLPRQVVLKQRMSRVEHVDLADMDELAAQAEVEQFKQADRAKGFNISADLLVRLSVLSLSEERHHMVMSFHHIILDGWCLGPLFEDFFAFYDRLRAEPDAIIAEREAAPYSAYIHWLSQQDRARAYDYWARSLDGYQQEVGVPYFDLRHEGGVSAFEHNFELGTALTAQLGEIARQHRLTVNSVFQTAWGILLQKYNNTDDVVFGTVVSGRTAELPGVERMVGLFINTQPLRVACRPDESFVDLALRTHQSVFAASAYEYYPLAAVQVASPLKGRLINHVVTFENFPLSEQMRVLSANSKDLRVIDVRVFQAAKFDFHVIVYPGNNIRVSFVYNGCRYANETVASFARSLSCLLAGIVAQPEAPVARLPVCAPEDARRVLDVFNSTQRDYPAEKSIIDLFEEISVAHSECMALRDGDRCLSYRALRKAAQGLAQRLRETGVQPGDNVALLAPRSAEMVTGMLAALYCGAAYLPLEIHASDERLRFMLLDSSARVLCVHPALQSRVLEGVPAIRLDWIEMAELYEPLPIAATQPAYVMYTSGSTGQPKACVITHRNVVRLVRNTGYVEFGPDQCILQTGSPAFDASTFEVWGALLNGGELVIVDEASILDAQLLRAALERYKVSILWLTSALFNQLCESDERMFGTLNYLVVGGDVLSPRHIERVRAASPQLSIVNGYGPTENTTFSTTHAIIREYVERIPIGAPITNSTAYVVDSANELLPPGAYGELCTGGDGVGLGYLNRPELSQEKFIADPFRPGGLLYRTGDVARWLPDGTLDLLGRNDLQIKIRGFRVELGEIERALVVHPDITDVVVVAHEGSGGKQLHAFYVGRGEIPANELRATLSALPSYMVPAFIMRLERMPLTVNGKLDRRALPIAESLARRAAPVNVEPNSQTEQRIAEICREVLGVDDIGVHDNFFEVGANSLNLIAINNRLKETFARDIPLAVLFEYTSIARLAEYIGADKAVEEARLAAEYEELDQGKNTLMRTRNLMKNLEQA